jgi:hypothetical protein
MTTTTNIETTRYTRYKQDGVNYICAGHADTTADDARSAASAALADGEQLADDMERIDGCCTWTVLAN